MIPRSTAMTRVVVHPTNLLFLRKMSIETVEEQLPGPLRKRRPVQSNGRTGDNENKMYHSDSTSKE